MARSRPAGILLASLLLSLILVAPAAAMELFDDTWVLSPLKIEGTEMVTLEGANLDLDPYADGDGRCITGVVLKLPDGAQADITLYDYSQTITGSVNVSESLITQDLYWSLGEDSFQRGSFKAPYQTGAEFHLQMWTTSAFNGTAKTSGQTYVGLSDTLRGNHGTAMVPLNAAVSRLTVTSSQPITLIAYVSPISAFYDAAHDQMTGVSLGLIDEALGLLGGLAEGIYLVISLGWYVFKIVFLDNFLLFFGLFEAVGLAYAANKSKDIFQFYRRIVDYNAKVFRAMFWLIERMVTILTRIIDALNPIG